MNTIFINTYLLLFSVLLSYFDLKSFCYPLFLWFFGTCPLLPFYGINSLFIFLLIIAFISNQVNLNIGSGDFLYLATLSLILPMVDLLCIIQIGAFLGIFYAKVCCITRLPLIPFLTLAFYFMINI